MSLNFYEPSEAEDLQREYDALTDRRSFGLIFERHVPEAVELPGRRVRKGDKVRVIPPRGESSTPENDQLWQVTSIAKVNGVRQASLIARDDAEQEATASINDLVVVAEFRDAIYPGLVSNGKVERGGNKPFHAVVNAENFHALQTLLFTHRGEVDVIYIDPPYNTGARDWKYNNDYVEGDDIYRHSKWLAFMERRLLVAKQLLNPDESVLIVTIDEKEYLRLGLLLEQTFPDSTIQMVSTVINPKGVSRGASFRRFDEYIYTVMVGAAAPSRSALGAEWSAYGRSEADEVVEGTESKSVEPEWTSMMRRGSSSARIDRPNMFYPIYADPSGPTIVSVGDPIPADQHSAPARDGLVTILPIRRNGAEGRWQVSAPELESRMEQGRVRLGRQTAYGYVVNYLPDGAYESVLSDRFVVEGRADDGSLLASSSDESKLRVPPSQWKIPSHNASEHGSTLLDSFIPRRKFPFPKSLYAVEDVLRFFVSNNPSALVVDFFAGSGTTAHAVMRLNRQDGGYRRSIIVTNNEVAADEQKVLKSKGLRPGDSDWECRGISEFVTKPRIEAAITGRTPEGDAVLGDYKFNDVFPIADGLQENVEFFTLTYEAPLRVASNREFIKIAPLLWLRAGALGRRIDDISAGWDVADVYGVIANLDQSEVFLRAIEGSDTILTAFIVTDEDGLFESMVASLPEHVEPVRLYEAYLRNFEIEAGRSAR